MRQPFSTYWRLCSFSSRTLSSNSMMYRGSCEHHPDCPAFVLYKDATSCHDSYFHFLFYRFDLLDVHHDIPAICNTILNKGELPLDEGYVLIIRSLAGLDD